MGSTRSGRVFSVGEPALSGRVTRSRAKKENDAPIEESTLEDTGQTEVTSPAPSLLTGLTPLKESAPSPAPSLAFGSPMPTQYVADQQVQQGFLETPFQERVVKTVGKASSFTLGPRTPTGAVTLTPTAKEIRQIHNVPLPDEDEIPEPAPYATSDDEPVHPASPEKPLDFPPPSIPTEVRRHNSFGKLLFWAISVVTMISLAFLLLPCADPELYALVKSPGYERLCRGLVLGTNHTVSTASRVYGQAVIKARAFGDNLPPAALQSMDQAFEPIQQAHRELWKALSSAAGRIPETIPGLKDQPQKGTQLWRRYARMVYTPLAPTLQALLTRAFKLSKAARNSLPSFPSPEPIGTAPAVNCLSLDEFLEVIDQSPSQQQLTQALWHTTGQQVSVKRKAVAWVLTCRNMRECSVATDALMFASSSYMVIDGALFSDGESGGKLQHELANFLRGYPKGLVLVTQTERMHPASVAVLNSAMSESGHLQMDGKPLVTHRALYLFMVLHPEGAAKGAEDAGSSEVVVKDWLSDTLLAVDPTAEAARAIVRSFRRRLDAVLPVRQLPEEEESNESV